jgi:PQQ-dependent catabolism-associated CXXCW motif protein
MNGRLSALAVAIQVLAAAATFPALAAPPEPDGYRMEEYRAPVPATLRGARVVSTEEAAELWRSRGAAFVDVLPKPRKPELPEGTVWRDPVHLDIPGSIWLPDVGFGALSQEMETWYSSNLAELTGGDKAQPLVIYCKADCWMSWNAGKRAIEWGYSGVIWYPAGTDGWQAAGLPLEERISVLRPGEVRPDTLN